MVVVKATSESSEVMILPRQQSQLPSRSRVKTNIIVTSG